MPFKPLHKTIERIHEKAEPLNPAPRIVYEQDFYGSIVTRNVLIGALRAALNAAEQGEDVVHIAIGNVEIDVDYESGELTVYA